MYNYNYEKNYLITTLFDKIIEQQSTIITDIEMLIYISEIGVDSIVEEVVEGMQKDILNYLKEQISDIFNQEEVIDLETKRRSANLAYKKFVKEYFKMGFYAGEEMQMKIMIQRYAKEVLCLKDTERILLLSSDYLLELTNQIYQMKSADELNIFLFEKLHYNSDK